MKYTSAIELLFLVSTWLELSPTSISLEIGCIGVQCF
jgi:hypothetical protein